MRQCPWCRRQNLNVYAYCQTCGRGFDGPEHKDEPKAKRGWWPFAGKDA